MKNRVKAFSFICILVVFISCHKDSPTPPPVFTDQGNIGTLGGTVKTNDGASVEIPQGALNSNRSISITNRTQSDTIINNGCNIYELKPDGLIFSDSVTITLPYNNKLLDLNSQESNYGVGIMVYHDSSWVKLKSKIDLNTKTIKAKTTHFSNYYVYFPWKWADYFRKNKNITSKLLTVSYYGQGNSQWCAYYSLSMITKYAGYFHKAPYFASLQSESSPNGLFAGLSALGVPNLDRRLSSLNIATDVAVPAWFNTEDLCGYILKQLNDNLPVWVGSPSLQHAFVVCGNDATGFYINDPSGAYVKKVYPTMMEDKYTMVHISYPDFLKTLSTWLDDHMPMLGAESTIVIKSAINSNPDHGVTLNFPPGLKTFQIKDTNGNEVGSLEINGKNKPDGYSLKNNISGNDSFNGSDYMQIIPIFSNSNLALDITANLYCKIDDKNVIGSPTKQFIVPARNSFTISDGILFQLSNLSQGSHKIGIELRSSDNLNLIYDYWEIPFKIATAHNISIPTVSTKEVTSFTSTSAIVGGNITADGGSPVTELGVYWGTSPNPETTGTKLPISSITGAFSTNLPGLNPNTLYYVKAYAINSQGKAYGLQISFTTLKNITIPSVTTTPITSFTSTTATVGGNVSADGGASVTERGVYWGTSQNPETTGTKLQIGSGTGPYTTNLSGLTPSTSYYVKAYAINSQGPAYGSQVSITTTVGGQTGTVTDIDGNIYNTIVIGTQEWMAENLKTSKYNNGDVIPTDLSNAAWNTTASGAYAIYNNDNPNNAVYGKLYNFYSVVDSRNLCPTGWHVPNKSEYDQLLNYLGGIQNAYSKLIQGGSSGVNITFGGNRDYPGNFAGISTEAIIWSSSNPRWYLDLSSSNQSITWYTPVSAVSSNRGYSIRCLQGVVPSGTIPTNGLVAYYPFSGNANDESGNGNNGSINGATPTADRYGNSNSAYSFNGTSNYITVQNSTSLQLTNSATFNIWVSVPSGLSYPGGGASPHVFCKGATYGALWADYSLQLVSPYGTEGFESNSTTSSSSYNLVQATNPIGKDSWHMITIVFQGGQVKFYTDGTLTDTKTNSVSSFKVSTLPLYIGARYLSSASPYSVYTGGFTGKMDNIRIYNRVLTDQEITALFNE